MPSSFISTAILVALLPAMANPWAADRIGKYSSREFNGEGKKLPDHHHAQLLKSCEASLSKRLKRERKRGERPFCYTHT